MDPTDEELFLKALQKITQADLYKEKFGENSPKKKRSKKNHLNFDSIQITASTPDPTPKLEEPPKPTPAQPLPATPTHTEVTTNDFKHMLRYELHKITIQNHSKYYAQTPTRRADLVQTETLTRTIYTEPLSTDLHDLTQVSTLLPKQKELLERFQNAQEHEYSEISLRKLKLQQALAELKDEIEYAYRKRIQFVRVITGKGLQSRDYPVIKYETIRWIELTGYTMIFGYAPEIDLDGNYGAIIVELNPFSIL